MTERRTAPEYLRGIFNRAGIVMPAILLNGQVVGCWKRKNGVFTAQLFASHTTKEKNRIAESAEACFGILSKIEWSE